MTVSGFADKPANTFFTEVSRPEDVLKALGVGE